MKTKLIYSCLLICLFIQCTKEANRQVLIDEAFQPFVDFYIEEAAKRGIEVDFEKTGMSITFGEVPPNSNGVCKGFREGITSGHEIVIHRNRWDESNESWRERLILHELGHCHLYRAHTADTLANGEWKSIMRGESPPGFGARSINFTGTRKKYYLDELFNVGTSAPEWENVRANYSDFEEGQKETIIELEAIDDFFRTTDLTGDFEIEMEFIFTNDLQFNALGFAWGGANETSSMQFAISGGNNIFIVNRIEGFGIIRIFENYEGFQLGVTNIMTVQKIGNRYFYFYNQEFLYWSDFEPLPSSVVQITKNDGFDLVIDRFTVKRLVN